jgi:importin-4
MRKRVSINSGELWLQVPQNEREEIKANLPQLILVETKYVLFLSVATWLMISSRPGILSAIRLPA